MLTQANLAANARAISEEHALGPPIACGRAAALSHQRVRGDDARAARAWRLLAMPAKFSARTILGQVDAARLHLDQHGADDGALPARGRRRRRARHSSASASAAPLRRRLPPEHHPRVRGEVRHRRGRDHGAHRDGGARILQPVRGGAAQVGSVGRASGCEARVDGREGRRRFPTGPRARSSFAAPQVSAATTRIPRPRRAAFSPEAGYAPATSACAMRTASSS